MKAINLIKSVPCMALVVLSCACGAGVQTSDASASESNHTCLARARDAIQAALVPTFSWNPAAIPDRGAGLAAAAEAGARYGIEGFTEPATSRLDSVVTERDWQDWRSADEVVQPTSVVVTAIDRGARREASGCFGRNPSATAQVRQTVTAADGNETAASAHISRTVEVALAEQDHQIRVAFIRSVTTD